MADVRIKIGISVDADASNIMRPVRDATRQARQQMNAEGKISDKEAARASLAIWRDGTKEQSRLNREMFKAKSQAEREAAKIGADAATQSANRRLKLELENIRKVAAAQRNADNIASREKIARERDTMKQQQKMMNDGGMLNYFSGRSVVNNVGRDFGRFSRGAMRVGGQIASGMGIDFDLGSAVRRNVERQRIAVDVSNSAFQPGAAGAAGVRQDPQQLEKEARELGNMARIDPTKALQGMAKFTEVSGDLETSRAVMKDLVMLSQATGSQLDHVSEAAGNVNAQLGDMPNKQAVVLAVMRAVAGQGKLGAIELKDQAKQMAALAAQAGRFGGKPEDTIVMMGILAQAARQHGTAKSASEASFAVSSFASTFSKSARLKEMRAFGIDPLDKNNMVRDPQSLIKQILTKSKGNPELLNKMVMDARANKVILPFQTIFNKTKGSTNDKLAAVDKEFERLRITMKPEEIAESARRRMDTDEAKAQLFQNQLDEVAKKIQAGLAPALERLAPDIIKVVEAFGSLITWAAGNPWAAASAALAVSVGKAAIGEVIARALGVSLTGQLAVGGLGAAGGAAGSGVGVLLSNAGIAALAIGALGLAADQAQKLWNETHVKTTSNMTPEEEERVRKLSPEERMAEFAANTNVGALENAGKTTGKGSKFGPPTAVVDMLTDPKKLINVSELQLRILTDTNGLMRSQLVTLEEIRNKSGMNPGGSSGFDGPPAPSPTGISGVGSASGSD